ncbi:hypothetical protein BT96DRAFT_912245 [Gymnopus androsaceus JB14]|uniref:Uncharacterized protein n=1 Tax=Gymnopus androsaceus JB14 TaxID=1447944 RepID=A0A6A4IES9_9AGAR|nr:hypothetical protein BT96DRAFT_912245 [Gymnopus androsaceus JB14]
MAPTLSSAVSEFVNALSSIIAGLFNSLMAVFQAIIAFFMSIFTSTIQLFQSFLKLGIDVCQGVVGFVAANFLAIAVLGGAYYFYTNSQSQRSGGTRKLARKELIWT